MVCAVPHNRVFLSGCRQQGRSFHFKLLIVMGRKALSFSCGNNLKRLHYENMRNTVTRMNDVASNQPMPLRWFISLHKISQFLFFIKESSSLTHIGTPI
jgi:hypothetical protein